MSLTRQKARHMLGGVNTILSSGTGPVSLTDEERTAARAALHETLDDAANEQIRRLAFDVAKRYASSPELQQAIRDEIRTLAIDIAKDVLAEHMPDLEPRVRAIVAEQWDAEVAKVAHGALQAALQDVKKKVCGG